MLIPLLLFLFGAIFAGIGVFLWLRHNKLKTVCTKQTGGTVRDVHREVSYNHNSNGSHTRSESYYPEFGYWAEGKEYIKRSSTGSNRSAFSVGQNVTVFYNPADPNQYYVAEDKTAVIIGPIFAGIGAVIIIAAIVFLFL